MSKQYLTLQREYGKVKCSDLKKVKEEYYGKKWQLEKNKELIYKK